MTDANKVAQRLLKRIGQLTLEADIAHEDLEEAREQNRQLNSELMSAQLKISELEAAVTS